MGLVENSAIADPSAYLSPGLIGALRFACEQQNGPLSAEESSQVPTPPALPPIDAISPTQEMEAERERSMREIFQKKSTEVPDVRTLTVTQFVSST